MPIHLPDLIRMQIISSDSKPDRPMRTMRIIEKTAKEWEVQLPVPGVLHSSGSQRTPSKGSGLRHVGRDRASLGGTWPGRDLGVRAPDPGETPLSRAEVRFAIDVMGILDEFPVVHRYRPAGTWERAGIAQLAKPSPWEGLL